MTAKDELRALVEQLDDAAAAEVLADLRSRQPAVPDNAPARPDEREKRRCVLQALHERIEAQGTTSVLMLGPDERQAIAADTGLTELEVSRVLARMLNSGELAGMALPGGRQSVTYRVIDLTDQGLTAIGVLSERGLDALVAALDDLIEEVRADPTLSPKVKDHKTAIYRNAGAALRVLLTEVAPKALAEYAARHMGG